MTEPTEAEKAAAARDFNQKVFEFAQTLGCSDEQAEVFAASQQSKFSWTGVQLIWNDTKKPAIFEPAAKAYYEQDKFKFLLPPPKAAAADENAAPEIPAAILASALTGNMTDRGRIVRAFGNDIAAADKFIAAERAKIAAGDDKSGDNKSRDAGGRFTPADKTDNPWLAGKWNLTEQMRVFRQDPALATRLAAKAGVHVGAARPAKVAS